MESEEVAADEECKADVGEAGAREGGGGDSEKVFFSRETDEERE